MAVKKLNEIYKCSVCGNMVEVIHVGGGVLVCCGKEMILQEENTTDGAVEKHVPVIEREGNKVHPIKSAEADGEAVFNRVKVKIGEVPHPMEEAHYIEWIEILADGISYKKFLQPGEAPEAEFEISTDVSEITAREYCNLHGLWKK